MDSLHAPRRVGRYALFGPIASGGMATVHFGWLRGEGGFGRIVAVKALHPHLARDPEATAMLIDEARLAARIHHPNVARTLDVVHEGSELLLVMEYVAGAPLSVLLARTFARGAAVPPSIVVAVVSSVLRGLHAAHEAPGESGAPLGLVHRDVSPQNVLVGSDGVVRLVDFGIAKAAGRLQTTREGQLKGKLAYMAPEQIRSGAVDRRTDLFAVSVLLWEMLAGERLYAGEDDAATLERRAAVPPPPSARSPAAAPFDAVTARGLQKDPRRRFTTALEMARLVEECAPMASTTDVSAWVEEAAGDLVEARAAEASAIEAAAESARPGTPPADAERPAPRRIVIASVAALVVAAVAIGAASYARRRAETGTPAEPTAARVSTVPAPAASASAVTTDAEIEPPPSETATAGAPRVPVPAQVRPHPAARSGACTPPYTVDPNGFKKYKLECL